MGITQKELARQTGVTPVLVSRALNNHPSVAAPTRQRIQEAALRLGYTAQSNSAARSLILRRYGKRMRHNVFAVMLYHFEGEPTRNVPFFVPILDGIEREAAQHGIDLTLHIFRVEHVPFFIREGQVDGVICFHTSPEIMQNAQEQGLPMVMVGQRHLELPGLHPDDFQGMLLATRHLVASGHSRIGYIGQHTNFMASVDRLSAYHAAMEEAGLIVRDELIEANLLHPNANDGSAAMKRLLARTRDFSAIVCYNDTIAMGAIRALREAGLSVPEDISVIGFDDVSEEYSFSPAISSIRFDGQAMGRRSVQLLENQIARRDNERSSDESPTQVVFPVELVERESTRPWQGS